MQSSAYFKPNSVPARKRVMIIHLDRRLPGGSSDLPGNATLPKQDYERAVHKHFPIWSCTTRSLPGREMLPLPPVSSYLTISPITPWGAGLLSVALVVAQKVRAPGCYPARCPTVFGLSSLPLQERRSSKTLNCTAVKV